MNNDQKLKIQKLSNMTMQDLSEYSYNIKKNTKNRVIKINEWIKKNTNLFENLLKKYGQNKDNIHWHK